MAMTMCKFSLKALSPYSGSRRTDHFLPKKDKEKPDEYEKRTWKSKFYWDEKKGYMYIPSIQFIKALQSTASYLGEKVKGKGQSTWAKNFRAGVTCLEEQGIVLPDVTEDNVQCIQCLCDSQGKKGGKGGSQVMRTFPIISEWEGDLTLAIIDKTIDPELLERYLSEAGLINGIGRWRPQNGGMNGRFVVNSMKVTSR